MRISDWSSDVCSSDLNPPSKFAAVFARAKAEGFFLTMHCDIDQVGSIDNIRAVLEEIGVDRLDHGTNIVEDPALIQLAKEDRKNVVSGKSGAVRVDIGGRRIIKKKKKKRKQHT